MTAKSLVNEEAEMAGGGAAALAVGVAPDFDGEELPHAATMSAMPRSNGTNRLRLIGPNETTSFGSSP
jgi:hypothetical protein